MLPCDPKTVCQSFDGDLEGMVVPHATKVRPKITQRKWCVKINMTIPLAMAICDLTLDAGGIPHGTHD